jgi:hypothetical protein
MRGLLLRKPSADGSRSDIYGLSAKRGCKLHFRAGCGLSGVKEAANLSLPLPNRFEGGPLVAGFLMRFVKYADKSIGDYTAPGGAYVTVHWRLSLYSASAPLPIVSS